LNAFVEFQAIGVIAFESEVCTFKITCTAEFHLKRLETDTFRKIRNKIQKGAYVFAKSENFSDELVDFIQSLLIVDPLKRMTAEEACNHQWVVKRQTVIHAKVKN